MPDSQLKPTGSPSTPSLNNESAANWESDALWAEVLRQIFPDMSAVALRNIAADSLDAEQGPPQ